LLLLNACGQHLVIRLGLTSAEKYNGLTPSETGRNIHASHVVFVFPPPPATGFAIIEKSIV